MNGLEYKELHSQEGWGSYGGFGIKILVAASCLPDLTEHEIWSAARKAADIVSAEVQASVVAHNEKAQEATKAERQQILSLFPGAIYVEEIPNGYCSSWCCRHLPWFIVTTTVGRVKIGWRKRVINIDWTDTVETKKANELFSAENVTKGDKYIHAWSLEDARRYISTIIEKAERL